MQDDDADTVYIDALAGAERAYWELLLSTCCVVPNFNLTEKPTCANLNGSDERADDD